MSIKIQIANLEALERLIGNDNELEIEIRESIVQKFADKHLKPLANAMLVKNVELATNEFIRKEFLHKTNYGTEVIKPTILDNLKSKLKDQVEYTLLDVINKVITEQCSLELIADTVESVTKNIVKDIEKKISENHIEKMVQQRLKEKLGL